MERRSFQREGSSDPPTLPALNVFDDEFAIEDFDIADGFRPEPMQDGGNRQSHDEPPITSVSAHMSDTPMSPIQSSRALRNSIRKPRRPDNPFASAEDEPAESPLTRTPSQNSQSTISYAPGITHRSTSSASSHAFARSGSPFQGGSGPSHPYFMYPQGTMAGRTPSISTTSTVRPIQRPLSTHQGPAHPYRMYAQNVVEDTEDEPVEHLGTTNAIPVGFPGHDQPFHRRRGPDGEEQDIIGTDGHSEQLPPYSEYPEDGPPKDTILPLHTAAPGIASHLALPLMQRGPQSMSDLDNSAAGQGFVNMEQMDTNETVNTSSKKSWSEKSWKEKRKTKFCGIPLWWILLAAGVVAFIAIVLGGAIGGILSTQRKNQMKHAA